jgi:hypothetical protein
MGKKKKAREAAEAYAAERLEEARGPYIGPVDRDEAFRAIRAHTTGPVLIDYPERGFAGGERRRVSGRQHELGNLVGLPDEGAVIDDPDAPLEPLDEPVEDPPGGEAFAFIPEPKPHIPLSMGGVAYADAFVLDLSGEGWTAERYTDGLDLRFREDCLVRLVFWHSTYHVTESGDVVAGMGSFAGEVTEEQEGD